MHKYEEMHKI